MNVALQLLTSRPLTRPSASPSPPEDPRQTAMLLLGLGAVLLGGVGVVVAFDKLGR